RNYLVPVDAQLKRPADLEEETLRLDWVQARLKPAGRLQLLILDACRSTNSAGPTPVGALSRVEGLRASTERRLWGLEPFAQPGVNVLVAYAAKGGQVALDGQAGENCPYAKALLKHLAEPGLARISHPTLDC